MLGAIIGAIGGLLGQKASEKASAKAAAAANASQERIAQRNIELQKEFAKTGIQWKVQDANKAGVHPLFALGANTHSFSPVSVGTSSPSIPDYGSSLSAMGQGIGNAIEATASGSQRMANAMQSLQLERLALENETIRTQLTGSRLALSRGNPALPVGDVRTLAGQGNSPLVVAKPAEVTPQHPDHPGYSGGINPQLQWFTHPDGSLTFAPSANYKESTEDSPRELQDFAVDAFDAMRGNITPPMQAKPGHTWAYNALKGRFYQIPIKSLPSSMGGGSPNTYRRQPYGFR